VAGEVEGPLTTRHCISNRVTYEKLEVGLTYTKHSPGLVSNRGNCRPSCSNLHFRTPLAAPKFRTSHLHSPSPYSPITRHAKLLENLLSHAESTYSRFLIDNFRALFRTSTPPSSSSLLADHCPLPADQWLCLLVIDHLPLPSKSGLKSRVFGRAAYRACSTSRFSRASSRRSRRATACRVISQSKKRPARPGIS
jgi:hypothetical protein